MEVADQIVVMNEGRIEQIGSPAEIYDQPATPFVMSFVGAVNVLPAGAVPAQLPTGRDGQELDAGGEGRLFVRPHDLEVFLTPQPDTVPARLKRLVHMGRDLQAELVLADATEIVAQIPREKLDYGRLQPGDQVHVLSRQARVFMPDYAI